MADRKRRDDEKEKKLEEDKKYREFAEKKVHEEVMREKAVKEEMEEFYRQRTLEAEQREERAEWRGRRMELRSNRILFWRKENKKMGEWLKKKKEAEEKELSMAVAKWTNIKVVKDEMENITLVLEDQEGNIVSVTVSNYGEFTPGQQSEILITNFAALPGESKMKLLENVKSHEETTSDSASFRRGGPGYSSGKRKRPESFIESAEKRLEDDGRLNLNEPATFRERSSRNPKEPAVYESLAAAFDDDEANGNVKRRTKRSSGSDAQTVIDGRKRPVSKSIEQVLYPSRYSQSFSPDEERKLDLVRTEFNLSDKGTEVAAYSKVFPGLNSETVENFTERVKKKYEISGEKDIDPHAFTPLSMLMENSILIPLRAQISVVNAAVVDYFLVDAGLMAHFRALRNYVLLHDGEFAAHLTQSVFGEVFEAHDPGEILKPVTLNRIVENSMTSSTFGKSDPNAPNVGFLFQEFDETRDILECLKLGYQTSWPTNIILTQDAVDSYGEVFKFLIQIRKAVWGLEKVFFELKEIGRAGFSAQVQRCHLMRHEMLNFVTITLDYVTTQVLGVSWTEFERNLREKVDSLEGLYEAHMKYLNKIIFR